jgi:hypothetical protein
MWRNYESYLGLLLLLNEGDIRIVQRGAANVATMEKLRTYVTSRDTKRRFLWRMGGCINDKSNGASKHTRTALKLSRAVCAATDLSSLMKNVVPQAKDLYDARQRRVYLKFWLIYKPYFKAWINSIKSFFRNVKLYRVLLQSQPPFWMVSEISNIRSNVGVEH